METMYFTFGVLTMVAMLVVAAVVYSILTVFKQSKQIKYIQTDMQDMARGLREDMNWRSNDANDRFKDVYQQIENAYTNAREISNAYTDSRVDKLEDKLTGASVAKEKLNNKNLLKG
jgi:predicted Holliday junction resolvase-like endonuclease